MNKLFLFLFFFGWMVNAQHQDKVDFIHGEIMIGILPQSKEISGHVSYELRAQENIDSVFLDAKNMKFESVEINGKKAKYSNTGKIITLFKKFKAGKSYKLFLSYSVKPKQAVYFMESEFEFPADNFRQGPFGPEKRIRDVSENVVTEVWTQGQGKYTSHWLPSFDDMEEKIEFDLAIVVGEGFEVISNGKLIHNRKSLENTRMWSFDMQKPMSSYLLAFAIGNYSKQEVKSKSGIPIENYYYPIDSLKVEPTYRYTKEIFDFLEEEISFPYPWQNYKQIPVRDFLYAGMENTTTTIFSDAYVIDSTAFVDKNYVNVNAHELAHQWFGNLVTEKDGNHHWLHEGFATYYAQLAEKEIFGDDHYYWKLYKSLTQLQDEIAKGEGQALTDPKASSLVFYEKGAWALYMLRNQIGDSSFRKGVQSYLEKYKFKNVTIPNFLEEMETASGEDLSNFNKNWLESAKLPFEEAKKQLRQECTSLDALFSMEKELHEAQSDDIDYQKYWDATNSEYFKKHLLENYERSFLFDGLKKAFQSNSIIVRQAMLNAAPSSDFLPKEYLLDFLEEDSYITIEMALFQLWQGYPEDRAKYLDATKDIVGLPNKNVRLLWLTLAMLTDSYNGPQTKVYFDELSSYTSPEYGFEIRQGAFFYLKEAFGLNDESLSSLVKATNHHAWQFKKFARNLLRELLKDPDYKTRLEKLSNELKPDESRYLKSELEKE